MSTSPSNIATAVEMEPSDSKQIEDIKRIYLKGLEDRWCTREEVYDIIINYNANIRCGSEDGPRLEAYDKDKKLVRSKANGKLYDNLLYLPGGPYHNSNNSLWNQVK